MVLVWSNVSSDETEIKCCGSSDDLQDWRHCGSWSSICSRWDQETFFRITHRTGFFEPTDQRTGTTCFDSLVPGGRLARKQDQSWIGTLSLQGDNVEVIFGKDSIELESDYSFSGRGMELSDGVFTKNSVIKHFQFIENSILIHLMYIWKNPFPDIQIYDGCLTTVDDKTGIVFKVRVIRQFWRKIFMLVTLVRL